VVSIFTITFNIKKNSTFWPHHAFKYFVYISEQKVIISLYSINWLVFITDMASVYYAVRAGYLNVVQVTLVFKGLNVHSYIALLN
jgi:hypothetical protein